jgi:hypothetical protein
LKIVPSLAVTAYPHPTQAQAAPIVVMNPNAHLELFQFTLMLLAFARDQPAGASDDSGECPPGAFFDCS